MEETWREYNKRMREIYKRLGKENKEDLFEELPEFKTGSYGNARSKEEEINILDIPF